MLESFPFSLLVGTLLGFLSGLGVGGGSLLVLWLTLVLGWDPAGAASVNLLFFLPAAAIACIFRWKQGLRPGKNLLWAAATGCVCAWLFSRLRFRMDTELLRKLFGVLLLATGVKELLYHAN